MTRQDLIDFISPRSSLNANNIAEQSEKYWGENNGVSSETMYKVLDGSRTLTKRTVEKILPILIKYGYKNNEDESK